MLLLPFQFFPTCQRPSLHLLLSMFLFLLFGSKTKSAYADEFFFLDKTKPLFQQRYIYLTKTVTFLIIYIT